MFQYATFILIVLSEPVSENADSKLRQFHLIIAACRNNLTQRTGTDRAAFSVPEYCDRRLKVLHGYCLY